MPASPPSPRLIGALPTRGVWTAVGLGRGQFLAILGLSVAGFVLIGGPVWHHVHDRHFVRIVTSYLAIVPLVAAALAWNGAFSWRHLAGGTIVIALAKLLLTAGLLVVLAIA